MKNKPKNKYKDKEGKKKQKEKTVHASAHVEGIRGHTWCAGEFEYASLEAGHSGSRFTGRCIRLPIMAWCPAFGCNLSKRAEYHNDKKIENEKTKN